MKLIHPSIFNWMALLATASVLSGCAGMESSSEHHAGQIKITSEPAGAVAYADGSELGVTPLEITPANYFRSGFMGLSYRYLGRLSIKKAGCETWSTEVDDAVLAKDIHAKLKCDPDFKPASAPASAVGSAPSSSGDQMIERLERIESLHKKGLISDEEYKQLRARVIEGL
jgi:hypothetical protein